MTAQQTDGPPLTWQAPTDETWTYDPVHFPRPIAPLTGDIVERLIPVSHGCRAAVVNGYVYMQDYSPPPPPPEVMARGGAAVWFEDYAPQIGELCARMRSTDYDAMTPAQLFAAATGLIDETARAFGKTMSVLGPVVMDGMRLIQFCRRELGEPGVLLATTLLQGFRNETAGAGAGLARLAEAAARLPGVAACLRDGRYGEIASQDGGEDFLGEVEAYLAEYGWRSEEFGHPEEPTWAEAPEKALELIGHYVRHPRSSPAAAIERALRQRDLAREAIARKLDAGRLAEFATLVEGAREYVPVSEGRAFWQLTLVGSLRAPLLALGRRLVALGALSDANDVFYLHFGEVEAALSGSSADPASVVQRRKADMASRRDLTPPPFLGSPPSLDGLPEEMALGMKLFFGELQPSVQGKAVKGQPASQGTYTGVARVITDLRDAARLQPGEVLVCATTSPPWAPLFAVAGAVVTDTGGILSHSAICAREYAVPCVVSTLVGTSLIPDGATVTVDGTAGTVTIEA
jgi:phosphohistidine swiveling domain-containing protein